MEAPPEALELRNLWDHRPDLPEGTAEKVLAGLDPENHWTARLYAVRLVPFLRWNSEESRVIVDRLLTLEREGNLFVRAWALDSLTHFAEKDAKLADRVLPLLVEAIGSGSGAVRARAKAAMKRLA